MNDPTGKPIIMRRFEFKFPPDIEQFPTEKELAEFQMLNIEPFLWRDELVLIDELRVNINKKEKTYDIFAPCQPRRGSELREKLQTLQDVIKPDDTGEDSNQV